MVPIVVPSITTRLSSSELFSSQPKNIVYNLTKEVAQSERCQISFSLYSLVTKFDLNSNAIQRH